MSRILLTSALPYANGSIHIGHLVEHVQSDIWARAQRALGHDVLFVCADDAHGTAIELRAEKLGIAPEALIDGVWAEHVADLRDMGIAYDVYYSTHSPENRAHAESIYGRLLAQGHIVRRTTTQLYSAELGRFLSDRMVKGTCPRCGTADQYGDVCESCGATYDPTELKDAYDIHTNTPPVQRETENLYLRLSDFGPFLREWTRSAELSDAVRNYLSGWLDAGLQDWCISRDAPYFGFEIPGAPGKFFYVWLDAPIGYIAATDKACAERGLDWRDYWAAGADARIVHNIGKDIVYFHTLYWPAMLKAAGLKTPARVNVHGMLTVNGRKMSKSRGTLISARTYLDNLDPDYLRYYYAAKLTESPDDLDLSTDEFVHRVNAELVNNVVNLCSRITKFIAARFDGTLGGPDAGHPLALRTRRAVETARDAFVAWDFRAAVRCAVELGNEANLFMQESAPWTSIKTDEAATRGVCAQVLHAAIGAMTILGPVTPKLHERFATALGVDLISWSRFDEGWWPTRVEAPDRLLDRVDPAAIQAVADASAPADAAAPRMDVIDVHEFGPQIDIDAFGAVDLRVGVVEEARAVEGADKLLQLTVHCGRRINVFAGVRKAYPDPSILIGRRVVVVANLKPRKMKFGVSEGMLLATSGPGDEGLQLVHPDASTRGGWTVR